MTVNEADEWISIHSINLDTIAALENQLLLTRCNTSEPKNKHSKENNKIDEDSLADHNSPTDQLSHTKNECNTQPRSENGDNKDLNSSEANKAKEELLNEITKYKEFSREKAIFGIELDESIKLQNIINNIRKDLKRIKKSGSLSNASSQIDSLDKTLNLELDKLLDKENDAQKEDFFF